LNLLCPLPDLKIRVPFYYTLTIYHAAGDLERLTATNMAIAPPLSSGWGYGIVLGLGALFALGMVMSL
jgi:hypothetical protein